MVTPMWLYLESVLKGPQQAAFKEVHMNVILQYLLQLQSQMRFCRLIIYAVYTVLYSRCCHTNSTLFIFAYPPPSTHHHLTNRVDGLPIGGILFSTWESYTHRKIGLIEAIAKCRHPIKLTLKGTLRQVFICLRPHREGGEGGTVEPEKRLEGQ